MQMNKFLKIIKKRLDNYKNSNNNCQKLNEVIFELDELVNIAETQISKSNNGWISVDELPNDTNIKGSYLAYSIHTKFYERVHIEKLKVMINHSHPAKITHFKPLPQPPKE